MCPAPHITIIETQTIFAVTISAKRNPDMSGDIYHEYISETHAGHLKYRLVEMKIVDYPMVRVTKTFTS